MLAGGCGGDFQASARDGEKAIGGEGNAVVRVVKREGARRQLVAAGGFARHAPRRAEYLHVLRHAFFNDEGDDRVFVAVGFAGTERGDGEGCLRDNDFASGRELLVVVCVIRDETTFLDMRPCRQDGVGLFPDEYARHIFAVVGVGDGAADF